MPVMLLLLQRIMENGANFISSNFIKFKLALGRWEIVTDYANSQDNLALKAQ